jgi:hypothetical protein
MRTLRGLWICDALAGDRAGIVLLLELWAILGVWRVVWRLIVTLRVDRPGMTRGKRRESMVGSGGGEQRGAGLNGCCGVGALMVMVIPGEPVHVVVEEGGLRWHGGYAWARVCQSSMLFALLAGDQDGADRLLAATYLGADDTNECAVQTSY